MPPVSLVRCSIAAGCFVLTVIARAEERAINNPNATMRYVAVSAQGDNADNREFVGTASFTIGEYAWAHIGAGTLRERRDQTALSPSIVNAGAGIANRQLGGTIDFSQRKDGDRYSQIDYKAGVDWHNEIFGLGLSGMHRNTKLRATTPVTTGPGSSVNTPVMQSLSGDGFGLQARFNPTERLALSLGGAHYNYDTQTRRDGAIANNGSNSGAINTAIDNALRSQPLLADNAVTRISGVTREAAVLQSSWNVGVGYRLNRAAVNLQYFHDQALDDAGAINTFSVNTAVYVTDHWTVSPTIGHSGANQSGGTVFGSLAISYGW